MDREAHLTRDRKPSARAASSSALLSTFAKSTSTSTRQIKFRCSFSNTIYDVLCAKGWVETTNENDWDIQWADREWVYEVFDQMHLEGHQRLNHFRSEEQRAERACSIKLHIYTIKLHTIQGIYTAHRVYGPLFAPCVCVYLTMCVCNHS